MIKMHFALLLICTLYGSAGHSQLNPAFIHHVSDLGLKEEHWRYLSEVENQSDTLHYYKAKFHLQYGNDSLFFSSYKHCRGLFLEDTNAVLRSHHYFLTSQYSFSKMWFNDFIVGKDSLLGIPLVFLSIEEPSKVSVETLPGTLRQDFLRFNKYERKKPIVAATFSALIPGAGKLYIGNKGSFFLTFTSLAVIGLQTWESYRQLGIEHPLTIIGGSLFSIYYGVNVFGSYRATKEKKKQVRYQYLVNASNYYHNVAHTPLY